LIFIEVSHFEFLAPRGKDRKRVKEHHWKRKNSPQRRRERRERNFRLREVLS